MDAILLEDVLATVTSKVAIMKIDVEGYECKVRYRNFSIQLIVIVLNLELM